MPVTQKPGAVRRCIATAAATVVAVGGSFALVGGTARADFGGPAFDGYAQGNAVDATVSNPSLPLGLVAEGAGPEASSHLTSYGQSDAEASYPYLGPVTPGLPGILGGLYGVPVPAYPLAAQTGSGDKPEDVNYPGVALHAESGTASTVGAATVGNPGAADGSAGGRIDVDQNDNVTATATSAVTGLSIGGLATISGLSSTASVVADGTTGKLTRSSSFTIGQISAPGLHITVPPTTPANVPIPIPVPGVPQLPAQTLPTIPLPFGGTTLPTPDVGFENGTFTVTLPGFGNEMFAIPASAVLSAFSALGIVVAYQPATETPTGIQGASLSFTYTVASLPANMYFSGPTPITETLGSAIASVTLQPAVSYGGGTFPTGGVTVGGTAVTTPTSDEPSSDASTSAPVATPKKTAAARVTVAPTKRALPTAAARSSALPSAGGGGGGGGTVTSGAVGVPGTGVVPIVAAPGVAPVVAAPGDAGGGSTSVATDSAGTTAAVTTAPQAGTAPVAGARTASSVQPQAPQLNLSNIYLAFVLVAAAALTSMTTLRLLGVRTLWSS